MKLNKPKVHDCARTVADLLNLAEMYGDNLLFTDEYKQLWELKKIGKESDDELQNQSRRG